MGGERSHHCPIPFPCVCPPLKRMLYFKPSSLSSSTNNIDCGEGEGRRGGGGGDGGGFTAFKQNFMMNEIFDKRARFRQACQLLLTLIVGSFYPLRSCFVLREVLASQSGNKVRKRVDLNRFTNL